MKDFDFLVKDFGFTPTIEERALGGIVFVKESLTIEMGWYKGEVDVDLNILLENSVFRPYISRRFCLGDVVLHIEPNAFNERPTLPKWALSAEDAHCMLQYYATLMQKFCLPVLQGDFAVLEALTWKRRRERGTTEEERYGKFGQGKPGNSSIG